MVRARDVGFCSVESPGCRWTLGRDQYVPVRTAWLKGAEFVDTVGLHGDKLTLRLTEVECVSDVPPFAVLSSLEEKRADEADDSLTGGAV